MKMCERCGKEPAAVPDRERMGRPTKRICRTCHAGRLMGDLKAILKYHDSEQQNATGKDDTT